MFDGCSLRTCIPTWLRVKLHPAILGCTRHSWNKFHSALVGTRSQVLKHIIIAMKYFVFESERATLVGSQNRCVVGLPSETHLNFYQVDIEDFDNEVYSYEVEARNDEEAANKAEQMFNGDIYTMYVYLM